MAGFYPDVPAPRMAYDRDGTAVNKCEWEGSISPLNSTQTANLNDEIGQADDTVNWSGGVPGTQYLAFMFPENRDVLGYFVNRVAGGGGSLFSSTDSTNGLDGNWTSHGAYSSYGLGDLRPFYRSNISTVSITNVKAIRFSLSGTTGSTHEIKAVHLYGAPSSIGSADTLRVWHPTLDEPLDDNTAADGAHLDWGDVPQGTTADRTFRIKNNSATLTANSISIGTEVLYDATPALADQITYSNGGTFDPSINIGNLAPGAISGVISVRKATVITAEQSVWTWRTNAEATSWS